MIELFNIKYCKFLRTLELSKKTEHCIETKFQELTKIFQKTKSLDIEEQRQIDISYLVAKKKFEKFKNER